MAIINSFTSNGVTYPQAYIQVSYHKLNSKETVLQLLAWTSEDARHSGASPLPAKLSDPMPTNLNYEGTLLGHAYALIKNCPEYANAIDV